MAESRGHSPAAVDMRRNKGGTPQPGGGVGSGGGGGGGGQAWDALVNVVLIEGKELLAMDFEGTSDPYCKFRSADVFGTSIITGLQLGFLKKAQHFEYITLVLNYIQGL